MTGIHDMYGSANADCMEIPLTEWGGVNLLGGRIIHSRDNER